MDKQIPKPRGLTALRFYLALWGGKLTVALLKLTRHNGTYLPGEVAMKLCPEFLKYVARPDKIITVTGTDGKTSVSNLLCDMLESAGHKVLNNRMGSNINSGIAASLLTGATIFNKPRHDIAVLEVDERSSRKVYPYVHPDLTVITNLFRDSLMRNAHPEFIKSFLTGSFPPDTRLILNGDDLISSGVAPENPRVYFGIERMEGDVVECVNRLNDLRVCPKCFGELEYEYRRYHHIGKAKCKDCGFASPACDYVGFDVDLKAMTMRVRDAGGEAKYRLLSDSVFNIYNELTAITVMRELGMSHEEILRLTENLKIVESRYKAEHVGNVDVIMQMSKDRNPLASSRAIDYVTHKPGDKELLLMMNNLSDEVDWSENICWLYDCDFEFLADEHVKHVICTGPRARDYYLRLLLAGVPGDRVDCVRNEFDAADKLHLTPGTAVYLLYGADNRSLTMAFNVREKVVRLAKEAAEK